MTAVHVDANSIRVRYTMPGQEDPVDLSGLGASFGPQLEITDEYEDDEDAIPGDEAGGAVISGVAGDLAAIYPTHACEPLGSTGLEGRVAIVDRGRCSFLQKVQIAQASGTAAALACRWADLRCCCSPTWRGPAPDLPTSALQNAGAVAVLVVNTLEDGQLVTMGDDGTGAQPDIVAVSVRVTSLPVCLRVLTTAEYKEGARFEFAVDFALPAQAELRGAVESCSGAGRGRGPGCACRFESR